MDVIVIDSEVWLKLNQQLNDIQSQLKQIQSQKAPPSPSVEDKVMNEVKNYVHIDEALPLMHIEYSKWHRVYQHIIQHKGYGRDTWIYMPSWVEFMKSNNINEGKTKLKKVA